MTDKLCDKTFTMFAMKHYSNPECSGIEEFHEDLNRVKYLKRLFGKYKSSGILKERLILNHIIIIYNVFPLEAATRILFYKIEEKYHIELKTFLAFLGNLPTSIPEIDLAAVPMDNRIVTKLREI